MAYSKNLTAKAFLPAWFALVMQGFLPALLLYFLVFKPVAGGGYGVAYTIFYLVVVCPIGAVLLIRKWQRKQTQSKVALLSSR